MYDNSLALMQAMREAGIEYRSDTPDVDENVIDTVRVGWTGRHLPRTVIMFRINERGAHLEVILGDVAPGHRADLLEELNRLNARYRWLKLALDDDGALWATTDVFLVPEVAGLFGIAAMGMLFDMLDEIWPGIAPLLAV